MFFSRVRLSNNALTNPRILDYVSEKNIYASHQLLWRLFPSKAESKRPFLYREEFESEQLMRINGSRRGVPIFYVVSQREPSHADDMFVVETKPFSPILKKGEYLSFDLRANPVVARRKEGRKNPAHHDVVMDAKRRAKELGVTNVVEFCELAAKDWLIRRSESWGIKVKAEDVMIRGERQHVILKSKGSPIRMTSIDYRGSLQVEDPVRFRQVLFEGVGRARAFGCGLFLVRRMV